MRHHTIRIVVEGELTIKEMDRLIKEIDKQVKHFEVDSIRHGNWIDKIIEWWTT